MNNKNLKIIMYSKEIIDRLNNVILSYVQGEPTELYEASAHLLKAGGKRLRPILLLAVARGYGLEEEKALPAAAAIELLHNFTLVHDDIMDRDAFRRNVPTVHTIWGDALAILAGDLLFSKAFEAILDLERKGIKQDLVVKAARKLAWASVTVAEGQALDMNFEKRDNVSEEDYMIMIEKKTAALFKAAAEIGAIIAGATEEQIKHIGEYARLAGKAFQIRDDILGLIADEKKLGKPVYSDIREGKRTILVIYALGKLDENKRKELLSILGDRKVSIERLRYAVKLIEEADAFQYAWEKANKLIEKALQHLDRSGIDQDIYEMLRELAIFIISREK